MTLGHCRYSQLPYSDRTCYLGLTGNNSGAVQQCTGHCLNGRQSYGNSASLLYKTSCSLPWQNTVDRRDDIAKFSTAFEEGNCLRFDAKDLNVAQIQSWELVQDRLAAFAAVTKSDGHRNTEYHLKNKIKPELCSKPFLSLEESTSAFARHSSYLAQLQHNAAAHSTPFLEVDDQPVVSSVQFVHSTPHANSDITSSFAQFPVDLEVPTPNEHDIRQATNNLQPPVHAQTFPFTFEKDTIELSQSSCKRASPTSIVNETLYASHRKEVDSKSWLCTSMLEENLEKDTLQ
jgi:hypothetical protein